MTTRWLLPLFLVLAGATAPALAGDDPAVARLALFLDAHGHQSGVPDAATSAAMRPLVSAGLDADLADARTAQAEFVRDHPDEKPPFLEGPLFNSSGYEPYTAYEILPGAAPAEVAGTDGARRVLRVRYTDSTVTPALTWEDEVTMVHEDGAWRVDDVAYRAGFDYGNHGSLRAALNGEDAAPPTSAEKSDDSLVPDGC
jgi:hypothetical protein